MQNTRGCLLELQKLASSDARGNRDKLLDRVTDLFFLTSGSQGEAERTVFGDAMERIAYELETDARARLAERLAGTGRAPRKLVVKLAGDEIGVARPLLEKSPCLNDDDLTRIAASGGQGHLQAISGRRTLSPAVTDVIVRRGDDTVLTRMAANKGAAFSIRGLERLSTRAEANAEIFSALEMRADVPREVLAGIKRTIAARLKRELAEIATNVTEDDVDAIIEAKVRQMNLSPPPPQKMPPATRRKRVQTVTENMVVTFARSRMLTETIQCLSLINGMSVKRVTHCLLDADLSALAVLCKANKFKNTTFAALIQLRSASSPLPVRIIADAMRHYDLLDVKTAARAIEAVRKRAAEKE